MHKEKDTLEFEVKFFEGIVQRKPSHLEALKALAELYTRAGDYEKGLDIDLKLSKLLPRDATVQYNLACSNALLGDTKKAIASLRKAVILGYKDCAHMRRDPDLKSLHDEEEFKEILRICRMAS